MNQILETPTNPYKPALLGTGWAAEPRQHAHTCCLWLGGGAAAATCCAKPSTSSSFGHSLSDRVAAVGTAGAVAPCPCRAQELLCCSRCRRGGQHVLPCMPRVPTVFPTLPKKTNHKTRCGRICSDKTSLDSVAAHNVSPYFPHCLSQYLTCNGE